MVPSFWKMKNSLIYIVGNLNGFWKETTLGFHYQNEMSVTFPRKVLWQCYFVRILCCNSRHNYEVFWYSASIHLRILKHSLVFTGYSSKNIAVFYRYLSCKLEVFLRYSVSIFFVISKYFYGICCVIPKYFCRILSVFIL